MSRCHCRCPGNVSGTPCVLVPSSRVVPLLKGDVVHRAEFRETRHPRETTGKAPLIPSHRGGSRKVAPFLGPTCLGISHTHVHSYTQTHTCMHKRTHVSSCVHMVCIQAASPDACRARQECSHLGIGEKLPGHGEKWTGHEKAEEGGPPCRGVSVPEWWRGAL